VLADPFLRQGKLKTRGYMLSDKKQRTKGTPIRPERAPLILVSARERIRQGERRVNQRFLISQVRQDLMR
jgi:hypothetical protein